MGNAWPWTPGCSRGLWRVRGATTLCWECLGLILEPGLPVPALVDGFDGQAVSPGEDSQGHIATHHLGKDLYIPAQTCFSL